MSQPVPTPIPGPGPRVNSSSRTGCQPVHCGLPETNNAFPAAEETNMSDRPNILFLLNGHLTAMLWRVTAVISIRDPICRKKWFASLWPSASLAELRPVSNLDVAPTLLEAAGASFEMEIHGRSLLPLCTGESESWRDDLMCETHGHGEDHIGRLVVTDRLKYVANQGQMDELYDLESDPYEMENLVDDPAHRGVLSDMESRLSEWQRKTGDKGHSSE